MVALSKTKTIAGIVLAGGNSRRFGEDKALYKEAPSTPTWVELTVSKMTPLVDHLFIVTNERLFPAIDRLFDTEQVTVLADQPPFTDKGPLGGIYTVMSSAKFDHYLISPTDTPNITTEIFSGLINARNAYAATNTASHYLTACIPYCEPEIKAMLTKENLRIRGLLQSIHAKKQVFPEENLFQNRNYQ